jgi:nitroreductase
MQYDAASPLSEDFEALQRAAEYRRSVRRFTQQPIEAGDMRAILELAPLAPSSSNLQPYELYWVRTPARRAALVEACLAQSAARQAQELVVCIARWDRWNLVRKEYLAFLETQPDIPAPVLLYYRRLAQGYYGQGPFNLWGKLKWLGTALVGLIRPTIRFPLSRSDMRLWATKSAALACENIMLAAAAKGIDTCAMEGNDPMRVGSAIGLNPLTWKWRWDVPMVLALGYRDPQHGLMGPRWRRSNEALIKEV